MEKNNEFFKALNKIELKIKLLEERAMEVRMFYDVGNLIGAYERALDLESVSEQAVLLTRVLPAYTGNTNAKVEVEKRIKDSIPIRIGFTDSNWFSVRIPALLPKKAEGSADYIRSYLYPAMRNFFANRHTVRYNDCILIYRHVYDRLRPERKKRDHDNIEVNMVSDVLAMYVMPDDGPTVCSHYYCSAEGSEDRTEVYVIPKIDFPIWLCTEKIMPDEGVKLYENAF